MTLENIIEALLMASSAPLSVKELQKILVEDDVLEAQIEIALGQLQQGLSGRSLELIEVATGWRLQVSDQYAKWVARLFEVKEERYSKAFFETLALIAYRQPITRGDIEAIRGVAVSGNIMRLLEEREWIEVIGRREVPGRPMIYGTTDQFLNDFSLKSLSDLPELSNLDELYDEQMPLNVKFPKLE